MGNRSEGLKKIVWAVDLLSDVHSLQASALKAIERMIRQSNAVVQPVYVFKVPADLSNEYREEMVSEARELATKRLRKLTEGKVPKNVAPPVIIDEPFQALRRGADLVVKYAKEQKADLIVVNTHLKKSVCADLRGSFSEGLALNSEIPVLSIAPDMADFDIFRNILFATDFSEESKEAYQQILELAKRTGSQITLFHKLGFPVSPNLTKLARLIPERIKREEEEARLIGESWISQGRENGVPTNLIFDSEADRSPAEAILKELEKSPAVVALVGKSGPFSSLLLGSTTRSLIKRCQKPILILHSTKARRLAESQRPLFEISEDEVTNTLRNREHRQAG